MKFVVGNEKQLGEEVYKTIACQIKGGSVFGLQGDLGSGKTTLVKYLAEKLGITETVTSPTFNLIKRYKIAGSNFILQHLDLYRLENPSHADISEITEAISSKEAISFIEWPERIKELSSKIRIIIKITPKDKNTREVEINGLEN